MSSVELQRKVLAEGPSSLISPSPSVESLLFTLNEEGTQGPNISRNF